jgi:hypothetical protein
MPWPFLSVPRLRITTPSPTLAKPISAVPSPFPSEPHLAHAKRLLASPSPPLRVSPQYNACYCGTSPLSALAEHSIILPRPRRTLRLAITRYYHSTSVLFAPAGASSTLHYAAPRHHSTSRSRHCHSRASHHVSVPSPSCATLGHCRTALPISSAPPVETALCPASALLRCFLLRQR